MSRRDFVLPPEALILVKQVADLEERAERTRAELAADLAGIRQAAEHEVREVAEQRREAVQQLERVREASAAEGAKLAQASADLARDREVVEVLLHSRVRGFGLIGDAWADYEIAKAEALAVALEEKAHPAPFAAAEVRSMGKETAALRRELKRAEWVLRLYEWHFPWLTELRDLEEEQSFVAGTDVETDAEGVEDGQVPDPAQKWLSEQEFRALSEVERNQRALERYLRSRKTP